MSKKRATLEKNGILHITYHTTNTTIMPPFPYASEGFALLPPYMRDNIKQSIALVPSIALVLSKLVGRPGGQSVPDPAGQVWALPDPPNCHKVGAASAVDPEFTYMYIYIYINI